MLSISVNCARLQIMKIKALSVTSAGGKKVTMNTLSWKLWAVKRKILNINDTAKLEATKNCWKTFCAESSWYFQGHQQHDDTCLFFIPHLLCPRYSAVALVFLLFLLLITLVALGEKENERTIKTLICLLAVTIPLLWEFHPRKVFQWWKQDIFAVFHVFRGAVSQWLVRE